MKAVPAQLALGLVNTWYAATVAWRAGSSGSGRSNSSRVAVGTVSSSRGVGLGPVPVMVPAAGAGHHAAWSSEPEPSAEPNAAAEAASGYKQAVGLPGAVETAVLSPRNTGTAVLRSRAGQQASADVL
jgi:hypothetical protein